MSDGESGSRITAALITAIAMIIVAVIGFLGIKLQTEAPIYATLTAQPFTIIVTMNSPKFTVDNRLRLPIKIFIEEHYVGDVKEQSSKVFVMESYPVKVSWEVEKVTLSNGSVLGHDMGASFNNVTSNERVVIDNIVGDQYYFYPIITNNTDKNCSIVINDSWPSEFNTNALVGAHTKNVRFGYYKLFSTSNISLECEGNSFWWGLRSDKDTGTSFSGRVESETGAIYFTLDP